MKKFIMTLIICFLATTVNAEPLFQAGDITQGKEWSISNKTGVASYYLNGSAGTLEFYCLLYGEDGPRAVVRPGKNFLNDINGRMTAIPLYLGVNGPFTWTLTDEHEKNGNVKVFYSTGSNVTVRCFGHVKLGEIRGV